MTGTPSPGGSSGRPNSSRFWKIAGGASAALCIALLTACGSSSSPSSAGSASAGASGTATASQINVGAVETASGTYGDPLFLTITSVWAKWTNAHGGINGHPVHLIVVDDAGDPAQGLSEVKALVQQDHVIAIVGSDAGSASSWLPYLEQQHVPVIGGSAAGYSASAPGYTFPASLSVTALETASYQLSKLAGDTKVGQFMALGAGQNLTQYESALQLAAKAAGTNIVYATAVSPTSPDYTAPCLSLKNAGANMAIVGISPAVTLNIMQTCLQQGYHGSFMTTSGLSNPAWNKETSLNGAKVYVLDDVWPFYQQSTPAQKAYFSAIAQYAPGMLTNPGYNAYVQDAWTGMQMFAAAAEAAKIGPDSTSADLVNGLYTLHNETLGGLIGPVTFSRSAKLQLANCYFVSLLANGQWTNPLGAKAQCVAS
jgi:branched-chain amino acid transport system substrate-binding protein